MAWDGFAPETFCPRAAKDSAKTSGRMVAFDRINIMSGGCAFCSESYFNFVAIEFGGADRLPQLHFDSPPSRRQHARTLRKPQGQYPPRIVPVHLCSHPCALAVVE